MLCHCLALSVEQDILGFRTNVYYLLTTIIRITPSSNDLWFINDPLEVKDLHGSSISVAFPPFQCYTISVDKTMGTALGNFILFLG